MKTHDRKTKLRLALVVLATSLIAGVAEGQLDETCTVAVLNRTARVNPDGIWSIPNVPTNVGLVRARATCVRDGVTRSGVSRYFTVPRNGVVFASAIELETAPPVPASLRLTASLTTMNAGETAQLTAMVTNPDGSLRNVTAASEGTTYTTSSAAVISISPDGLVTALGNGVVLVSALNEGALSLLRIIVGGPLDSDGDGMPDEYERQFNLDPNDPADASTDADSDGLTNLQEFQRGTGPRTVDTDGDGISDGLEVQTGSDPLNPGSYNLSGALRTVAVTPTTVELRGNPLFGDVSRQLTVTGTLLDTRTIDLTSSLRGTTYTSSDPLIVNFGTTDGELFAGQNGVATVTVAVGGFTTVVPVSVTAFTPFGVSMIDLPGYANNVKVLDGFAYVAAGAAGLQIVNVSDRTAPEIVASYFTNGRAYDLRVVGKRVYIADGYAGLEIINVDDPFDPYELGTVDTLGVAQDIWIDGNYAYIADGKAGLQIIDVTDPERPLRLSTYKTTGDAKGVSVSNGYAVVVTGLPNELVVVDVRDPVQPVLAGRVSVPGNPKDVLARGTFAYIAAYDGALQVVDFSIPAAPRVVGSSGATFVPRDVALIGNTAVFGEQLFPHAVPFVDVSNPANPAFRSIIDLSPLGDYAETGIDVDSAYVYTTAQFYFVGSDTGDNGRTALFIAQYAPIDDPAGAFPTVTITSPADGAEVVEGTTVPITVNATDDERVASVATYADSAQIALTRTPPFTTELTVPRNITSLTLSAIALDFANRAGQSLNVVVRVIPDPGTTITGIVRGPGGAPHPGVRVELVDRDAEVFTDANGRYTFSGVSSVDGAYEIYADAEVGADHYDARVKAVLPVRGGITNVPDMQMEKVTPVVEIFTPPYGGILIGGTTTSVIVNASSRLYSISSISVTVDGVVAGTASGDFANIPIAVPNIQGTLRINATATDALGHTGSAEEIIVEVTPDPMTTVQGTVVDANGNPVAGAAVTVLNATATTNAAGLYVINNVSTVLGNLVAQATGFANGNELAGTSEEWPPVAGGITWLDITVRSFPVGKIAQLSVGGYGNAIDVQGTRLYVASGITGIHIVDAADPSQPTILGTLQFMSLVTDIKVSGNTAYVAAGYLHTIDVSDPRAPLVIGTLPTVPVLKMQLAGNVLFTVGPDGLAAIDVRNPAAPRVLSTLGSFTLPPRAITLSGSRAIVAEHSAVTNGSSNVTTDIHVLDVSRADAPSRTGRVTITTPGRIHDVAIRGTRAYLAMTSGSASNSGIPIIDFSNPAAPVLVTTYTQANLLPVAIAAHGNLLVVAGGTTSPSSTSERLQVLNAAVHPPQPVTGLDTSGGANTAVAVSGSFAYALSGGSSQNEFGACCVNDVITARYRATSDLAGIRPTVTFVRPQPSDVLLEGSMLPIEVSATDDIAVNSVTINVNGAKVQTTTRPSMGLLYRIPGGQTSLTIAATATDFAGNTGDSTTTFQIATDPRTTVSGLVRTTGGAPIAGATVKVGALSTTTDAAGAYSLTNVPTSENVVVKVAATLAGEDLRGTSATITPVSGGTTNVPNLVAAPRPFGPISSISSPGHVRAAAVRGKTAYVINGSSNNFRSFLQVIDFSDIEAPRVIGQLQMFEVPFAISVSGNYAYLAVSTSGILIVDITDPTRPTRVRNFNVGNGGVNGVDVVGTTLYAGTQNGTVMVLDVSNPNLPVILSSVKTADTANLLALSGRYVLTAGGHGNSSEGGFNVTDVIDPRKAVFLSQMAPLVSTLIFPTTGLSVTAHGNNAYVAATSTLKIDFSAPAAPSIVTSNSSMFPVRLATNGKTLVAAGRPNVNSRSGILGVFDLAVPSFTPTLINMSRTDQYSPQSVTLAGDIALVTAELNNFNFGDFRTFFVKYPTTVDRAGVPPIVQINSPIAGDRLTEGDQVPVIVTATDDIGVTDVSITANGAGAGRINAAPYQTVVNVPAGVSTMTLNATATDLDGNTGQANVVVEVRTDPGTTVQGRVVAAGGAGVANATVKVRGQKTTTDATGSYSFANAATVPGSLVVEAVGRVNNLLAIGTSAPVQPNAGAFTNIPDIVLQTPAAGPIKSFPLATAANAVAMNNSIGLVALGGSGLMVLDLSNPFQPVHLATTTLKPNAIASDIKISGNFAYVAAGSFAGMNIVDLSNPALPVLSGNVVTGGNTRRLAASGTTVYVADFAASGGLKVIDASNPAVPAIVGSLVMNRWLIDIEVSGSYVLLLHSSSSAGNVDPRLSVIDVSNPASPLLLGSIVTPGTAVSGLVVRGTTAFVVGGKEIQMFEFSNPAVPTLLSRFSPTTVTAFAAADSGTHLLQVGTISAPHTVEIINATAIPNLALGGVLQYPNVTAFQGTDVAVADEFVISSGQTLSSWPLQTSISRIYIGKWRN